MRSNSWRLLDDNVVCGSVGLAADLSSGFSVLITVEFAKDLAFQTNGSRYTSILVYDG